MFEILLLSLFTSLQVFFTLPLIIGHIFKIQAYQITDQTERNEIIKKMCVNKSTFIMNNKPHGVIYGKWYVGYITKNNEKQDKGQTLYLIIRSKTFMSIKHELETDIDETTGKTVEQTFITICERTGNPWWWDYRERKYNSTKYLDKIPYAYQKRIIDNMLGIIKKKASKSGTFFIYGEPGSGKSLMLLLLAKQVNAYFCASWNPTDPGDKLSNLYTSFSPTEENPLVVVLEECDIMLFDIMNDKIERHKHIPIEVRKKTQWNTLLDKITDLGFYPHLILILTSNTSFDELNKMDASLLRAGRIDKHYHVIKSRRSVKND